MQYILNKRFDGTFTMNWVGTEISTAQRDIKTFLSDPTLGIKSITKFNDTIRGATTGGTSQHYFERLFSYNNARSGETWIENIPISAITMAVCDLNNFQIVLTYYRIDTDVKTPTLSISDIVIEGTYDIETSTGNVEIPSGNTFIIITPVDIYKIFKITDFEIYGINTDQLNIKYRITQDGGRHYTEWEPLTMENLSTIRINPLRFAQMEYLVQKKAGYAGYAKIYDIILVGDFQNINSNYLKLNRYGIKENCAHPTNGGTSGTSGTAGSGVDVCFSGMTVKGCTTDQNYNMDWSTQFLSCYLNSNPYSLTSSNAGSIGTVSSSIAAAGQWKPYDFEKIISWYNLQAMQVSDMFGWDVDYLLNDPDGNGQDMTLHENQLFNIVDRQKVKIIVDQNQFPDNQVQINIYTLDMFDTFEVLIMKDEFKKAFGIEKRPAQKDILSFCVTNRLYRVKHAQIFKDIMYVGFYYKVVLEKYEKLANEDVVSSAAQSLLTALTTNTTLDELFKFENREDMGKTIKKQFKPLTHDPYRSEVNPKVSIVTKDIINNGLVIAKSYYDFNALSASTSAVTYSIYDPEMLVSDNRAFSFWVNFNNKYDENKTIDENVFNSYNIPLNSYYEFLNNYDEINKSGYKIWYSNKMFGVLLNDKTYFVTCNALTALEPQATIAPSGPEASAFIVP